MPTPHKEKELRESWYQSIEIDGYGNFKEIAADYWLKVMAEHHIEFCEEVKRGIRNFSDRNLPGIEFCPMDPLKQCDDCQKREKICSGILALPLLNPEPTSNK